ncbi:MAG: LPXTG cell wall anchor domain-containing protein, partial [Alkalibacterium sp.]|nr:LPXTG cell wall anchor domain-containing protein [Alkalibacterium sp.]
RDYENNVELNYNNGFEVYVDTEENPPVVHTGGKAFEKVNQDGEGLAGAEFVIYNSDGLYLQEDYSWGDEFSAWTFVSDGDGYFEIKGLAYGNYYLKETKAPEVNGVQYRLLDDDYEFTVDTNSYYSIVSDYVPARPAGIENRPEISLPQTGGMGTLVFSIIGLGLMGTSVKLYKKSEK